MFVIENEVTVIEVLSLPILFGSIIAIINSNKVNDKIENIGNWIKRKQSGTSQKTNWISQYLFTPIIWSVAMILDWTNHFTHHGVRNGVRVASTIYLLAIWGFIIYLAFIAITILIIVSVVFYVVFKVSITLFDDTGQGIDKRRTAFPHINRFRQDDITKYAGVEGKKIFSGNNWYNEELKGRVDDNGNIYKGTNWFNEEKIRRIDKDGNILEGTNYFNEHIIGRIDKDGILYKGTNWFNQKKIGRIDKEGDIHRGTNWFNEKKTGRSGD